MRLEWKCLRCFWMSVAIIFGGLAQQTSYAQQDRSYRIITNQNALLGAKADTQRVKILNELAEDYQYTDGFKSLDFARQAFTVAKKLGDTLATARSQKNIGNAYFRLKNFNRAPVYLQQALNGYQKLKNKSGEADVLNALAAVYIEENPDKAQDYIDQALKVSQDENYGPGIATAYQNQGNYYAIKDDDQALNAYQKALEAPADSVKNLFQEADIYRAMGDYQKKKREYDKAIEHYENELKIRDKAGDKIGLTENLKNVGLVYQRFKKDDEKALEYLFQSYVVAKDYNDQFDGQRLVNALEGIVDSYGTLAETRQDEGKLKEARQYRQLYQTYKKRLEAVKNNPKNTKVKTVYVPKYITKTITRNMPGPNRNNNNPPLPESQRIRLLQIQKRRLAIDNLVKTKRIGVLEAAKKRAELLNQEDALRLQQKDKLITELKKDTSSKSEKITTLTKEKAQVEAEKSQRLWWLLGLALLALLIVLFLLYRKRQVKKKAEKEIEYHKNKSVNRINSQQREINEQKATLQKQANELDETKIKLDEVTIEKEGLSKVLKEDVAPPIKNIVDLTIPEANEDINRVMVHQSGMQVMNLMDNVAQVQSNNDSGSVILHQENHSIYKVSRSALDKVSDLVKEKGLIVDNQIKPFFYATFDYEVIERIFLNFFANALKYTQEGGKITLHAQPVTHDDKDVLEVVFRDSGVSVPEDKLHRVFDKFPPQEARPMGSAWAFNQMAVEAHGGKVEVLPADEGLHVTFTLPDAKSLEDVDYNDLLGVKPASTSEVDIDIDHLEFSEEEKEAMAPYLKEFAGIEYFETSALKAVLNKIDPQGNSNLTKWKSALEQAILYLDEESYNKLTQL